MRRRGGWGSIWGEGGRSKAILLTWGPMEQTFTSVSETGIALIQRYRDDGFSERMKKLETFMSRYLEEKRAQLPGEGDDRC